MTIISARWADNNIQKYGKQLERLQERFPKVVPRIVNQVGNRSKTQVIRALTKQTGLPRKTIVKAVGNPNTAKPGKLSYEMTTRGGDIRLKYFNAKEIRKGVSATPLGKRTLFEGAFMKAGRFPNRVTVGQFKGHVYRRSGYGTRRDNSKGEMIYQVRSGVFIPKEMTTGET
ncbi:hypothetical protein HBA92_22375, partial [Ochrobactrum sp. MR28]|nr:hypothetical protein [Ochrobactrum sp. MR28]MBX8819062.1 hypothetical protein [Ochrobactrum sp. MR31]